MSKRLWIATVEFEMVVLAEDSRDACSVAELHLIEDRRNSGAGVYVGSRSLVSVAALPDGWDGGCIPWGEENDRSIAEILSKETEG